MKVLLTILGIMNLFFSLQSMAVETSVNGSSLRVQELNEIFNAGPDLDFPILILNRDELDLVFATAGLMYVDQKGRTDEIEEKRANILRSYVAEKVNVQMSERDAQSLEMMYSLWGSASASHFRRNTTESPYMCAVIPPPFGLNQEQANDRLVQFQAQEVWSKGQNFSHLKNPMGAVEAELFSLYHEVGHCYDNKFIPENSGYEPSPSGVHEVESFAETMGALFMVQQGYTDILARRAYLRLTYSWNFSPYFHAHPEIGFGDPLVMHGGMIYALHKPLLALRDRIQDPTFKNNLSQMTPGELTQLAFEIVEQEVYSTPSFSAIDQYFGTDDKEAHLQNILRLSREMPEIFQKVLKELNIYFAEAPRASRATVAPQPVRTDHSSSVVTSPVNLENLALTSITDCDQKESQVRSFLGDVHEQLRPIVQEYNGYDVSKIKAQLLAAPILASDRINSLGCN